MPSAFDVCKQREDVWKPLDHRLVRLMIEAADRQSRNDRKDLKSGIEGRGSKCENRCAPWRLGRHRALGGLYAGLLLPENDSFRKTADPQGRTQLVRKVCGTAIRVQVTVGLVLLSWFVRG